MKNKLLFAFFVILNFSITSLHAQDMNPEMEAFIERMDGANLEELEKELDEGIEGLRAFAGFFDSSGPELKDYTKEEERFEDSFKIDTSIVAKAIGQFDNIGFTQIFRDDKSLVKFRKIGNEYWNTEWMGEGMEEKFIPKTIFYSDGSSISEGISDNSISFFFENPWGKLAIIDSIQVDYNIHYTAAYDSLEVSKNTRKIKYENTLIKIKKLEKNHLYLTVSDEYKDRLNIRALNAEGKFLNQNSSSFSPMPDNKSKDGFTEILSLLEEVQKKLKANAFKDTESLKKYLLKKVGKIESVKDKDGVYHMKYYFEGSIESLRLFIETEEKSKNVSFTATNTSGFGDIILIQNKTENIFLDANAKELFRTPYIPIESLGARYFQNDSLYYHLNLETKKLDELKVAYVWEATNGLAFIQKAKEDQLLMYNAEHELLSNMLFTKLYVIDKQFVQGIDVQNVNYILSSKGDIKKLEGISDIRDLYDSRMAAKYNDRFGFIDPSGEIAIPFTYREVENFKNGFAIVANEANKFGVIDIDGKPVVPLIYSRILSYKKGFAWVATEDAYQLINNDGKILISESGDNYAISRSGHDITLQFGEKSYDGYGNLIPEEKTND